MPIPAATDRLGRARAPILVGYSLKRLVPLLGLFTAFLGACQSDDVLDHIEDQSWTAAAERVSEWCAQHPDSLWWQRTRIEARREIRQRGTAGPDGPEHPVPGLDEKTAHGQGPVLMIWCEGERTGDGEPYAVPASVWRGMVRSWRD